MNIDYLAHSGEEHSDTAESLFHQIASQPLVGILVITAVLFIIAAGVIIYGSKKDIDSSAKTNKVKNDREDEQNDS